MYKKQFRNFRYELGYDFPVFDRLPIDDRYLDLNCAFIVYDTDKPVAHPSKSQSVAGKPVAHPSKSQYAAGKPVAHASKSQSIAVEPFGHASKSQSIASKPVAHASKSQSFADKPVAHASKSQSVTDKPVAHASKSQSTASKPVRNIQSSNFHNHHLKHRSKYHLPINNELSSYNNISELMNTAFLEEKLHSDILNSLTDLGHTGSKRETDGNIFDCKRKSSKFFKFPFYRWSRYGFKKSDALPSDVSVSVLNSTAISQETNKSLTNMLDVQFIKNRSGCNLSRVDFQNNIKPDPVQKEFSSNVAHKDASECELQTVSLHNDSNSDVSNEEFLNTETLNTSWFLCKFRESKKKLSKIFENYKKRRGKL